MPGTDSRAGGQSQLAVAPPTTASSPELVNEEGLATALSAFLAQLHDFELPAEPVSSSGPVPSAPEPAAVRGPEAPAATGAPGLPRLARRPGPATGLGVNPGLSRTIPPSNETTKAQLGVSRPAHMKVLPPVHRPGPSASASTSSSGAVEPRATTTTGAGSAPGSSDIFGGDAGRVPQVDVLGPVNQDAPKAAPAPPRARVAAPAPVAVATPARASALAPAPAPAAQAAPAPAPASASSGPVDLTSAAGFVDRRGKRADRARRAGPLRQPSRGRRLALLGAAGLALAAIGGSLAWGFSKANQLAQADQELQSTEAALNTLNHDLSLQAVRYRQLHHSMVVFMEQFGDNKSQLTQTDHQLGQADHQLEEAQARLTAAQDQVNQAQRQLGNTQQNLTTTQSHATSCQQGATLGQQTLQLMASVNLSELNYFNAAQTKNTRLMKVDMDQMRQLDGQVQAIGPKFSSALNACTNG